MRYLRSIRQKRCWQQFILSAVENIYLFLFIFQLLQSMTNFRRLPGGTNSSKKTTSKQAARLFLRQCERPVHGILVTSHLSGAHGFLHAGACRRWNFMRLLVFYCLDRVRKLNIIKCYRPNWEFECPVSVHFLNLRLLTIKCFQCTLRDSF